MSDELIAQARRFYHHVANGGTLKTKDVGRMVEAMEQLQFERDGYKQLTRIADDEIARLQAERDKARAQAANADAQCERDAEEIDLLRIKVVLLEATGDDASDEIERLRAERDRLREALRDIETPSIDIVCLGAWEAFEWMMERAATALKENNSD